MMEKLAAAAASVLLALVLAGCTGGDDDGDGPGDGTPPTDTGTETETGGPGDGNETPPAREARLTASAAGGVTPFTVTVQLDADDGDEALWSLEWGDGKGTTGDALPAEASHTYNIAGNFTVAFTASYTDGPDATDNVTLRVLEPLAPGAGPEDFLLMTEITGQAGIPWTSAGEAALAEAYLQAARDADANGTYVVWFDVPVTEGAKMLAGTAVAPDDGGGIPDWDVYVFLDNGFQTSSGEGGTAEAFEVEEPAAGTWTVMHVYFAGTADSSPAEVVLLVDY